MYPSQQQQLPFNPQQPTHPFVALDLNQPNPPFVPHYQCEPWLQDYSHYAAALLVLELQAGCQRGPLRIFTYNMMAHNNYQNPDFLTLFGATMDYVAMNLYQNKFRDPSEALVQLAPQMVTMYVAQVLTFFRPLENWIDQQQYVAINDTILFLQKVQHALELFRQQNPCYGYGQPIRRQWVAQQQPQQQYQQHTQYGGGGGQGPGMRFPGHNPLASAAGGGVATLSAPAPRAGTMQGGGRFGGGGEQSDSPYAQMLKDSKSRQPQQQDVVDVNFTEPQGGDLLRPPFTPRTQTEMNHQQQAAGPQIDLEADGSFLVLEGMSQYAWKPSERQAYRPAFHPSHQIRYHRVYPDGTVVVEVQEKHPTDMDFDQHNQANSVFGKPRDGVTYDVARSNQAFARGATEFAERMNWTIQAQQHGDTDEGRAASDKANAEPQAVVVVSDTWLTDVSETSLMLTTGLRRLARAAEGTAPDVFRMYGYVAEPVICEKDQSEVIKSLAQAGSYRELAQRLDEVTQAGADVGLVEAIVRRTIVLLNRVLALSLSIPPDELALGTDFDVATVDALEGVLRDTYGPVVYNAFKSKERNHIASIFQGVEAEDVGKHLRDLYLDGILYPEGKQPYLALLVARESFTVLDVYAAELDLDLDADTGSLISKENCGDVFQVLSDLFARLPRNMPFYRHLLQTNDGVLLEVVEGDIGTDAYLISRTPAVFYG
jgi:hypothetical protein